MAMGAVPCGRARSPEAYVDTSALIAFADRSDTYHPLFRRPFADPPRLVIAEGHAWFLGRYDATRGLQFMAMTGEMPFLAVAAVGPPEVDGATALLRGYADPPQPDGLHPGGQRAAVGAGVDDPQQRSGARSARAL
jgi:hypothetical protein